MHVTKIVWFDSLALFESFWYQKLPPSRVAFYSVHVCGTSFLSMCYPITNQCMQVELLLRSIAACVNVNQPYILHTSTRGLPKDWRRRPRRPRHTWLRTLNADLHPLNHGLNSARRLVQDRERWRQLVETATLQPGARSWWWWDQSNVAVETNRMWICFVVVFRSVWVSCGPWTFIDASVLRHSSHVLSVGQQRLFQEWNCKCICMWIYLRVLNVLFAILVCIFDILHLSDFELWELQRNWDSYIFCFNF